jgi:dolichol-phosphate mannosyltransferase
MPLYNEEEVFPALREAVERFFSEIPAETELVLVNDGSSDRTIDLASEWAVSDRRIKVIQLSRNFGHQIAATAGLEHATGDAIVLIDADLQDPLAVIHSMIERYCEGYSVAYGQRLKRDGETPFKIGTAWLFYRLMRILVSPNLPVDAGDFRLMSRECLDGLLSMRETHRFLRGMSTWVGFPQIAVPYQRAARAAGVTKYPIRKMLAFAWTAATSFSVVPLRLSFFVGIIVGLVGVEEAVRSLIAFALGHTVAGWTSLMVMVSLLGAALLLGMGILGEYVGRIYEEGKARPLYLVSRSFNVDSPPSGDAPPAVSVKHSIGGHTRT